MTAEHTHTDEALQAANILIVHDEPALREYLSDALRPVCALVECAAGLQQALRAMEAGKFDVVLSDVCMPGANGVDLLDFAQQLNWDCSIILMTGHANIEQIVCSVKLHAADFLL